VDAKKIAKDMRAEATRLMKAADILDPPVAAAKPRKRAKRSDAGKPRNTSTQAVPSQTRHKQSTTLPLGTAGRTSHPRDPDAEAIRDRLAYTTEEGTSAKS
jgi:hypothetical protein